MIKQIAVSLFIVATVSVHAETNSDIELAKVRCAPPTAAEPQLYQQEFSNPAKHLGKAWWHTLEEMAASFGSTYTSGKRLPTRVYYDATAGKFIMPVIAGKNRDRIELTENFILSVQKHIESALKHQYAEFAFFPDMGHSHLYFPQEHWDKQLAALSSTGTRAQLYTAMFADKELHVLYHTAEMLMIQDENGNILPDPHLAFRYWNRNVVGTNIQSDELKIYTAEDKARYNTVSSIPGYKSYSAGFNLSSSKDGCFVYHQDGEAKYFDLSLYDLAPDPSIPQDDNL